jgi:hypothetical protein
VNYSIISLYRRVFYVNKGKGVGIAIQTLMEGSGSKSNKRFRLVEHDTVRIHV